MKFHSAKHPSYGGKDSKFCQSVSIDRIKTWRHPQQHNNLNQKVSTQQKYNKICNLLMYNYFDHAAFGSFISPKVKQSKNNVVSLKEKQVINKKVAQINVENSCDEQYSESKQILKLQKMALNIKAYSYQNSCAQNNKQINATSEPSKDQGEPDNKQQNNKLFRLQSQQTRNRKHQTNKKSNQIRKIPVLTVLNNSSKKPKTSHSHSQNQNQKSRLKYLKRKIDELESEAVTKYGMKFTKIAKMQEQTENKQQENIQEKQVQILKDKSYKEFQRSLNINFTGQEQMDSIQNTQTTIPSALLNMLKMNNKIHKKQKISKTGFMKQKPYTANTLYLRV